MSETVPAAPWEVRRLPNGVEFPYYVIPFDKRGVCQAPATLADLLARAREGGFSDVFLFSHGWNNDWSVATERYRDFIVGYETMRRELGLPLPDGYRPLLVGVFWPSTALVFGEDERGPEMAAARGSEKEYLAALSDLGEQLDPERAERFFELAQKTEVDRAEAEELAAIAASFSFLRADPGETGDDDPASAAGILEGWEEWEREEADGGPDSAPAGVGFTDFGGGSAGTPSGGADGESPEAAGFGSLLSKLDPRKAVRAFTVWQMKDRAGRVGTAGVAPMLSRLLAATGPTPDRPAARTHLIGHSFGGKVVLSAAAACDLPEGRRITSMLLLQPAVNHLCFAEEVPKKGGPGGYRDVLTRVERPILSTFSRHDRPLTGMFHRFVRRDADLGEARIAAAGDPPSKYAALGGFGPRAADETLIEVLDPPAPYPLGAAVEVYGVDGSARISGHGDISNRATHWALHCLATA